MFATSLNKQRRKLPVSSSLMKLTPLVVPEVKILSPDPMMREKTPSISSSPRWMALALTRESSSLQQPTALISLTVPSSEQVALTVQSRLNYLTLKNVKLSLASTSGVLSLIRLVSISISYLNKHLASREQILLMFAMKLL